MRVAIICLALVAMAYVPANAQRTFDLDKERASLWSFFADKHADIGDAYKRVQLFEDARAHYLRAHEFEPDHSGAHRGLGNRKRGGEWIEDKPLPEKSPLEGEDKKKAREKPDEFRAETYGKCADRARRAISSAQSAGDERAARILAAELLRYAADDQSARTMRGHAQAGGEWMPAAVAEWRKLGMETLHAAGEGDAMPGEDPQAKEIGSVFHRRQGQYIAVRSTRSDERARQMHKHGHAHITRAMAILGVEAAPLGAHKYTLTHLNLNSEYFAMLEKVLKLEGDRLEFAKRLSGHAQRSPWGYIARSNTAAAADDMFGNTLAIRVLEQNRANTGGSANWLKTGFSYLVTSQVIGLCGTTRYSIRSVGHSGSNFDVLPEFSKKSGSPEQLRDVILNEVIRERDYPLERLVMVEVNDMTLEYAAKSFSLLEYFFATNPEATRKWLKDAPPKATERIAMIEKHMGKKVDELESEWREWVLLNY